MTDFVDYVEYTRPGNAKVRVAFEMLGSEVLFHYCEFQHSPRTEWKLMKSSSNENFSYSLTDDEDEIHPYSIQLPTKDEIEKAQQLITNKYNLLSI